MATIHCPSVDCPGSDNPIANLSSERPDPAGELTYLGIGYAPDPNDPNGPPGDPGPNSWTAKGCIADCVSTVTQEDADLCAARQVYLCQNNPDPGPSPTPDPGIASGVFFSHEQTCTSKCPDGLPFSFTVPHGTFVRSSQLLADRSARSYACRQARLHRICLSTLDPAKVEINSSYTGTITATGAFLDPRINLWEITSGALPAGVALTSHFQGPVATIDGTPTESGVFNFSIRVTAPNGDFMEKGETLTVTSTVPTVQAYWKCDSVAPITFDLVDSVTGLHLFYVSGVPNPTPPGKINNGIQRTPSFNASFDSGSTPVLAYPNTGGMSFFGWFKITTPDACAVGPELNLNTGVANITLEIANTNNPQNMHVYWNDANFQTNDLYFPVTTGAWHFFHLFFDPVAQKFGVSIDNAAATLDGVGVAFAVTANGEFNVSGPVASTVADVIFDEIGIKLDRKLTSDEQTFLYNAGAGRTYPF